ncbi:polysaccharide biosynthesis C-terminal domain-containing protein [Blautia hydrogenotrophica]|uniref:polysaccharide biosynthesis C-terminal domain-containing protein n=1 Tax=Blautia hydrogenotrophica TaxID=53443 RepID=UPI0009E91359
MDNVTFSFCHLYPMYRFLLFCHNKRPSYELDFIIEEPLSYIFTEKVSHRRTIFAAILNIILNAIFIPIFGFVAAAYTTLFNYVCLLFIHFFITERILKINIYNNWFMFGSVVITFFVILILIFSYSYTLFRYGIIITGFIVFLWLFRNYIYRFLGTWISKKK